MGTVRMANASDANGPGLPRSHASSAGRLGADKMPETTGVGQDKDRHGARGHHRSPQVQLPSQYESSEELGTTVGSPVLQLVLRRTRGTCVHLKCTCEFLACMTFIISPCTCTVANFALSKWTSVSPPAPAQPAPGGHLAVLLAPG